MLEPRHGPAPGTAPCPRHHVWLVTGTITAEDVIGPVPQGITAGEFDELVRAIRAGADLRERAHHHLPERRDPGPDPQATPLTHH